MRRKGTRQILSLSQEFENWEKNNEGCDFNDYALYEPGDKITYNLTKAQLSDQGEYKIDEDNEVYWTWLTIILGSIFIVVLSFTMLAQNKNSTKYEERLVKITAAYDTLIIIIAIVERVLI